MITPAMITSEAVGDLILSVVIASMSSVVVGTMMPVVVGAVHGSSCHKAGQQKYMKYNWCVI